LSPCLRFIVRVKRQRVIPTLVLVADRLSTMRRCATKFSPSKLVVARV
jgi:hypothetical protein